MKRGDPVRLLCATVALVGALVVPSSADVISDVGAIPSPFSPNGDGVFDSTAVYYALSEQAAVVVTVADSLEQELLTLWSGWEGPGKHSHWWGGSAGSGIVADGEYYFIIQAIPQSGPTEQVSHSFTVDTLAPLVEKLWVSPNRFSPDGDGVGDSVAVTVNVADPGATDELALDVLDSEDEIVRHLYSGAGVDSIIVHWDGRDDGANELGDQLLVIRATTRDAAGNADRSDVLVDLDTAPPSLGVTLPDTLLSEVRVEETSATLEGWAYDRAGVVGLQMSLDSGDWFDVSFAGGDTTLWQASLNCDACVPESLDQTVEVSLRGRDGVPTADGMGHMNTASTDPPLLVFDVVFDVAPPLHESSSAGQADAYNPGQTVNITSDWDDAGYDVTADFSRADSGYDPGDVTVTGNADGRYTITYQISDSNSLVPVTNVPVVITATDYFGRAVSDTSVHVSVVPGSGASSSFGLNANSFDPTAGEHVTIYLGGETVAVKVTIFNMAGTLVRTIEFDQTESVEWYGDSDGGEYVASGVYYVRIQTDVGDAVRKVAVVK